MEIRARPSNKIWIGGLFIPVILLVAPAPCPAQGTIVVDADCDGAGSTIVSLTWDGATRTGTGSCTNVTVTWFASAGTGLRTTATLTAPLTNGATTIPAANHDIKMTPSANPWNGDLLQQTSVAPLSAAISLWEERVDTGEQNRADTFSVDIRVDTSSMPDLEPGFYTGTVTLTVSTF